MKKIIFLSLLLFSLTTHGSGFFGPGTGGGGGGGETNLGSNINTGGVGVFDGKSGVTLQFRGVDSLSNIISVALEPINNTIDLDVT